MSKKGENIYKRKDKRWEARYIKGYNADGNIHYGYCYAKTYREAKEKLVAAKADILGKITPAATDSPKRFAAYCDEWLQISRSRVKESTYAKYENMAANHIKPGLGEYMLSSLSSVAIEKFGHTLLCNEKLSPKMVRCILMEVHAIIRYIQKQDPTSLQHHIEVIYPKDVKKEMRVLSREEQQNLTTYLLTDPDPCKFGVLLALLTGLRLGEICALRWRDISLEDRTLTVSCTMQRLKDYSKDARQKTKIMFSEPKSDNSIRVIPLTEYTVNLCRQWKNQNLEAFVLTGKDERYIEPRTLQYRLEKYTAECGLIGVHFHVLRHTFATRCVEVGFEIKSLSEILGHTSPKFTLERYVHSSMQLKRDNMNKLAAIGY